MQVTVFHNSVALKVILMLPSHLPLYKDVMKLLVLG